MCLASLQTFAQWDYEVLGNVTKGGKKVDGAVVTLYKGSAQVEQLVTTSNGKFTLKLEEGADYTISVTKAGHVTKKIFFSTRGVPADVAKDFDGGAKPEITLFELPKDPAVVSQINSILSQPIAKFTYDPAQQDIVYDPAYSQSILAALQKLSQIEKEAAKKAEEEAKNKANMESAAASKYEAAIMKGDAAFAKKDYTTARAAYTDALSIKVGEPYPKDKIIEIEKLIADAAKNAQIDADYKAAIAKADAALAAKNYEAAKTSYTDAQKLKPTELYPKSKLDEIAKLLADAAKNAELNAKYDAAIAKADKAFAAKTYDAAKTAYNEALAIKAAEKYPKDKLVEIDKLLAELAAKEKAEKDLAAKYEAAVAKGDQAFGAKDYNAAKTAFTEATGLKPSEAYPKTKLAEVDKLLADLAAKEKAGKELEEKYKAAIAKADQSFAAKEYAAAKTSYNEALALKASEQYPKTKIAEIDKILADIAAKEKAEQDKLAKEKELNDKYAAAITKGDAAFGKKDLTLAKTSYTEASTLKPAEQYPKDKLAEIEKAMADAAKSAELEAKYKAAITKADASLKAKKYEEAKAGYNEALAVKGSEQYPKDKITEIDNLLAKDAAAKEINEKYAAAVAKADAAFAAKTYEAAKTAYNEALAIKAAETYPKTKLAEIDKILADIAAKEKAEADKLAKAKELEEKYKAAISKADAALTAKDYASAKGAYNEALTLKAVEQYPKDKIKEIDAILAKEMGAKQLEEKYAAAIAKADAALGKKDLAVAKTSYTEASALKPAEQYPKDKLAEIAKAMEEAAAEKERLAKIAELDAKYKAAIAKADAALKAKTYIPAKTAYNEALALKPDEQYPKDKITEIDALIAKDMNAKELDEKYKAAVAKADAALKIKDYNAAKDGYNEALSVKANETYPKTKLAEIDKALADAAAKEQAEKDRLAKEKELNEKYAALVSKGDASLGTKEYEAAKSSYTEALALKPAEKYPKDKLAEINAILAKEMGAKELEKKYADAIQKGDAALSSKEYASAKTQYTAALALKPGEQHPKDKLAEAENALAALAAERDKEAAAKALEAKYQAAIAKGDKAFAAKTYAAAKTAYQEASAVKSEEQYPKDKIAEIEKLMGDAASEKERQALEAKYKAAIAKADAALKLKNYEPAKAAYNEALAVKAGDQYAQDKIAEIEKLIAESASEKERQAIEAKYKAAIAKADAALKLKNYEPAKAGYNEALTVKAGDQYAQDKIAEIEKLIAESSSEKERQALEAKYKAAIAKGDAAFKAKSWEPAKAAYAEALSVKSSEQYPKDQLAEIDRLVAELAGKNAAAKEIEEKYKAAITKADAALAEKNYTDARAGYNEALVVKPAEKYPKDKIAAIDALIAKESGAKQLDEKYKAAIAAADAAFSAKDYAAAKTSYTEASALKAAEQYPKDQLAKVNAQLAEISKGQAMQAKYDAAVAKADQALGTKDYTTALAAYKEAQSLKPSEPYPGNKITEINKIVDGLARAKEKEKQYTDLIAKADKLFAAKDYKAAKSGYLDAALVKPTEKYPKDKVAECDGFLKKNSTTTTVAATTNKNDFKSELAKKYPEGITEETATENNAKVTRRIVVKGDEGHMYVMKITSFGPVYYFKDNVPITEAEFIKDTEVQ
jgi:hypothetical protein